ncbi:MAG: 30S ribosomal protein S12 methylthiotransferase RimO [Candidatus Omnitrophica bacterium]|nr:30S ribosomal protein S12 methylthiotransferase RimO [Candidatus Omnitrophota bacterium]
MLSLGCARNLVDAEVILGYLKEAGFTVSFEIAQADVAIVNTCCFIREAEEESIDVILKLCRLKEEGKITRIIVCGCLAQRYKRELLNELKEVDAFVGVGGIDKIAAVVKQLLNGRRSLGVFGRPEFLYTHRSPRIFFTPGHFAYVKISEGCNHRCSYCIIPTLRGKYRSRPMDSILKEGEALLNKRLVSEINLIGQDTTMYGQDLYAQNRIAELLAKLAGKAKARWVRLLYAHPKHFSQKLMSVIRDEPSICKYIDLPIQHINDKILEKMNRRTSRKEILSLIERARKEIPEIAIRTTLIVGFPGETDKQFRELLDFIRDAKFERLGLFKYSRQADTLAYDFGRQVPEKIKQSRYDEALSLQQDISTKINQGFLGRELRVLIDEQDTQDKGLFLGRSEADAPEVDGCVYVHSKKRLKTGDFVQVKIIDTLEYDLVGEAL